MEGLCLHTVSKFDKMNISENFSGSLSHLTFKTIKDELASERSPKSAPTSRSNSFRTRRTTKISMLENEGPRRHSMPEQCKSQISSSCHDLSKDQLQRVRSFKLTAKGLVNKGDNFRRESNASVGSTGSTNSDESRQHRLLSSNSDDSTDIGSCASSVLPGFYKVIVAGANGVGKSSLIKQSMTSEYVGILDYNDDDNEMQTVSVHLDGEESTLEFVETGNLEAEEECNVYADAFLVVFSVNDRTTFDVATENIKYIREVAGSDRAIILVANKVDLARQRIVSSKDAKCIAEEYNCKYAETSVTLNHQVDELLAGLLKQIHFKLTFDFHINENIKRTIGNWPKSLFYKLFRWSKNNTTGCDNLYIT